MTTFPVEDFEGLGKERDEPRVGVLISVPYRVVISFRLVFVGRERRHPGVGANGKAWNLRGSLGAARGTGGGYV